MWLRSFGIVLFTCLLLFGQNAYRQVDRSHDRAGKSASINPILFRAYPVALGENQYKLYLMADIMYDYLQFTLRNAGYTANFRIQVDLVNEKSNAVYSRTWESTLLISDFEKTNSREDFFLTTDSISLPAGNYHLKLIYQDLQGDQHRQYALKILLPERRNFYASPPVFCDSSQNRQNYPSLFQDRPLVLREDVIFNKALSVFLNIFADSSSSVNVKFNISREESAEALFRADTALAVENRNVRISLYPPFLKWDEGDYLISILYRAGRDSLWQKLPFHITWFNKPRSIRDIEYALKPIQLIVPEDFYKKLTKGNKQEQQNAFRAFWKEKDPTPATAFNEVEAEFYSRVDTADMRWGKKGRNGWRTDPGKIYVIYGKPSQIEDLSLSPVNPYMKWTYNLPDQQLRFTFRALDGRKRYRLIDNQEEPTP